MARYNRNGELVKTDEAELQDAVEVAKCLVSARLAFEDAKRQYEAACVRMREVEGLLLYVGLGAAPSSCVVTVDGVAYAISYSSRVGHKYDVDRCLVA